MDKKKLVALLESKLKDRLQQESFSSIEKRLAMAKKGAKASGGGYSGWVKLSGKTWKNKKTGKMMHSQALASHIGGFNDFKIIGESRTNKGYTVVYRDNAFDKTYTAQFPAGITRDTITKTLKKLIRVGLQIVDISPIKEAKLEKEKFTDPDQMRMTEEVFDIFGYEATDFDICPGATSLYKAIVAGDHTDGTPSPEQQDMIVKSAKLHDILFKLEKDVLENGGTEEDLAKAERIADAIMKIADSLDLTGEHNYIQGHVDKIEKKVSGEDIEEAAPGYMHDCASKVVHEAYGEGTCIPEQHTLVKEGNKHVVTHYDVKFENGKVVKDIPVNELKVITSSHHGHKRRKKKKNEGLDPDQMRMEVKDSRTKSKVFKKGDKVKYLGHPATITKVKEYNGRLFYSVSYNKGSGKTKASDILSTSDAITETSLDPKAKKFLDIIKRSKSIRDLKDISVQATPKGNWEVSYKGKSLFTMDGKLLDDETIEKYGLRENESINEDRWGHPITAQGNQTYIQLNKLINMLSGKEKRIAEKAFRAMWDKIKSAMEAEESK